MTRAVFGRWSTVALAILGLLIVVGTTLSTAHPAYAGDTLSSFMDDDALRKFLKKKNGSDGFYPPPPPPPPAPPPPPPPPVAGAPAPAAAPAAAPAPGKPESITNTQEATVDEGGIVKVQGDILVILRRGRLFTVSIAGGKMTPIDRIDAFPPRGTEQASYGAWYDEMLISNGRVIVIGYNYEASGTEINRFRLSPDGKLAFEDSYTVRGGDYYSSRNYASRLIGSKLILYSPLPLYWDKDPLDDTFPALRRWISPGKRSPFRRIAGARQVYVAKSVREDPDSEIDMLHSVTTCDLAADTFRCSAVGVLGSWSRTFYVSPSAIYLWVGGSWSQPEDSPRAHSQIYRIPLGGGRPQAIGVRGGPIDQFSFREDPGVLNVLVKSGARGDQMWRSDWSYGKVALARIPLSAFGDGSRDLATDRYVFLKGPTEGPVSLTNRFVGDYLLFGYGNNWGRADLKSSPLWAARIATGEVTEVPVGQAVDRVEVLGRDALVVGTDKAEGLNFTTVELDGAAPRLGDRYVYQSATEGESRSHAFFYRPDPESALGDSGVLGLPVGRPGRTSAAQLFESSAAMVFLRRDDRKLGKLGELAAAPETARPDDCKASCMDWYGNARPIFLRGRMFALMGYELVEGQVVDGALKEVGRIDFAPPAGKPKETGQ